MGEDFWVADGVVVVFPWLLTLTVDCVAAFVSSVEVVGVGVVVAKGGL
jgi:hypothetical protein